MAETLQTTLQRICRSTQQDPNFSALSDSNDTNLLLGYVNEAIQEVNNLLRVEYDTHGSIVIPASTRLVALPTGIAQDRIYDWSLRFNNTAGDLPVTRVDSKFIVANYPTFEIDEADIPDYVYYEGQSIGVYPLLKAGSASLTLQFIYKGQATRLTALTDVMPFTDNTDERLFVEKYAQFMYEANKGFGNAALAMGQAEMYKDRVASKGFALRPVTLKPYRMFGRRNYA